MSGQQHNSLSARYADASSHFSLANDHGCTRHLLDHPVRTLGQEAADGQYEHEGYGVYWGKMNRVPLVLGVDDAIMTSASTMEIPANDAAIQPEGAREYMKMYKRSVEILAMHVWVEAKEAQNLDHKLRDTFIQHSVFILLTMSKELAVSIIKGDVPRLPKLPAEQSPQARRFLQLYDARRTHPDAESEGQYQPAIYAQYLCDGTGAGLKSSALRQVLSCLEKYIDDDEYAYLIELRLFKDTAARGRRQCLAQNGRKEALCLFIESVRKRLGVEQQPRPLVDFGYSNNYKRRLDDHARHINSNPILSLVDAICRKEFPDQTYRVHQYALYKCWAPDQGWVGEILLTHLGMGTIASGYGMSFPVPCRASSTFHTIKPCMYEDWAGTAILYSPFVAQAKERGMGYLVDEVGAEICKSRAAIEMAYRLGYDVFGVEGSGRPRFLHDIWEDDEVEDDEVEDENVEGDEVTREADERRKRRRV
ncbi:hypothetical protein HDK64DRAFT_320600 [Phyllosticta capitalensis]